MTTTLDGFGRTVRVQTGNGGTTLSTVDTQYAPCACSPLGKLWRVSQPYAPGGTPVWTTYTYDASGRTIAVQLPDGASTTTYTYQGNNTTVTDAAGKWKTSTSDAFGNLTLVTEPNPAGGANLTTSYTYNVANQLTQVSMTRSTGTQTRSFTYNGADMVSATNPENGTVTYAYDAAHRVTSRTDAMGQQTQYDHDAYGRVTEVRHYRPGLSENTTERVDYYYDTNNAPVSSTFAQQNLKGRLAAVIFGGGVGDTYGSYSNSYGYLYGYNAAGRVTGQEMVVGAMYNNFYSPYTFLTMTAAYGWDNEGRMTSMQYPTVVTQNWSPWTLPTAAYQYDANGRMNAMTWDTGDGNGPQPYAGATYGPAGEMLTLSYGAGTETRTYNSLFQLTHQVVPGYLDMTYNYSATQNNGRITGSEDTVANETTTYSYDALNRLTGASNGLWSEAYGYDGFGNLTSKSGTGGAPSMTATYDVQNRQTGVSYDANGNLSVAGNTWNHYNMENRLSGQDSLARPNPTSKYAYDPSGKRAMKWWDPDPNSSDTGSDPQFEVYFYGITGQKLVTVGCTPWEGQVPCWVRGQNVFFGGKEIVWGGVSVVTDRVGSVRGNTQGERMSYYPYGEERTSTVDGRDKFGTYFRDVAGQDYAEQRYYGADKGRFWSADPAGMIASDKQNPPSWNMYAYVNGDPANFNDPTGMNMADPDGGCLPGPSWALDNTCQSGGGGGGSPAQAWVQDQLNQYVLDLYLESWGTNLATGGSSGFADGTIALPAAEGIGALICWGTGTCEGAVIVGGVVVGGAAVIYGAWELGDWIGKQSRRLMTVRADCSVHQNGTPDHASAGTISATGRGLNFISAANAAYAAAQAAVSTGYGLGFHAQHCGYTIVN